MPRSEPETLTPAELRELTAIDAALEGRAVDDDLGELAELALALRAERGRPEPAASRRLDARLRPKVERPAWRWAPVAGLVATVATALVVAVAVVSSEGGDSATVGGGASSSSTSGSSSGSSAAVAPDASAGGAGKAGPDVLEAAPGANSDFQARDKAPGTPVPAAAAPPQPSAPDTAGGRRHTQRAARLELGAKPDDVSDVADDVVRIIDRAGGFVLSSSVRGGEATEAGAELDLRVPARRLNAVMADLSELGHVRVRADDVQDITALFASANERIKDARTERDALLRQLARADTPNETRSIRSRLRIVRAQLRAAQADLSRARRQESLSPVAVTIVADEGAATDGGGWTAGDAWHDAGRVLEVALGVVLVAGAALLPVALAALAAALAAGAVRRRRRERALDAS